MSSIKTLHVAFVILTFFISLNFDPPFTSRLNTDNYSVLVIYATVLQDLKASYFPVFKKLGFIHDTLAGPKN